ncbi:LytTR family DNA-binding domain-containing protein [Temperatibacter marinus]|uniref:LytTR family DNA-binding domain-containing protein n=1 Tax=Temperatibacter marinus TaxID=1456591 RepID=A0AA52EGB1_9PROT|nr:LytTR family DNA-binding domain-containing protein [Temperatibacter marinus]WND01999.1 LytTR family DNA-binding domain-containing protein [Temperatibacter marinus]
MTNKTATDSDLGHPETRLSPYYIFQSRPVSHLLFWLTYYVSFSLIWMHPDRGYFASFYLEFILLPVRIAAAYCMIYILMPRYLLNRQYKNFFISYAGMLLLAGFLQRLLDYYFYETLLLGQTVDFWTGAEFFRNSLLINTTVLVVGFIKMFHFYLFEASKNNARPQESLIEVISERRTHLLRPDEITHIESMGNYVTYCLTGGQKLVAYSSLKSATQKLPERFLRIHRSYVANINHIKSFNTENITIGESELPRGKEISDEMLTSGRVPK